MSVRLRVWRVQSAFHRRECRYPCSELCAYRFPFRPRLRDSVNSRDASPAFWLSIGHIGRRRRRIDEHGHDNCSSIDRVSPRNVSREPSRRWNDPNVTIVSSRFPRLNKSVATERSIFVPHVNASRRPRSGRAQQTPLTELPTYHLTMTRGGGEAGGARPPVASSFSSVFEPSFVDVCAFAWTFIYLKILTTAMSLKITIQIKPNDLNSVNDSYNVTTHKPKLITFSVKIKLLIWLNPSILFVNTYLHMYYMIVFTTNKKIYFITYYYFTRRYRYR